MQDNKLFHENECNQHILSRSFTELQNPIVFIEADTAFAKANTIPTDAPNSGPNDRDMM